MDYKEEQQNEIDALDSIYCGEMTSKYTFLKYIITVLTIQIVFYFSIRYRTILSV